MLIILNLPLVGIWVTMLKIPYRMLLPAIVAFSTIGVFTVNNSGFDVCVLAVFGLLGYLFSKLGCEPAPFLMGFVLGALLEEHLRRALVFSNGDPSVFVTEPISAGLLALTAIVLAARRAPGDHAPAQRDLRRRRQVNPDGVSCNCGVLWTGKSRSTPHALSRVVCLSPSSRAARLRTDLAAASGHVHRLAIRRRQPGRDGAHDRHQAFGHARQKRHRREQAGCRQHHRRAGRRAGGPGRLHLLLRDLRRARDQSLPGEEPELRSGEGFCAGGAGDAQPSGHRGASGGRREDAGGADRARQGGARKDLDVGRRRRAISPASPRRR